MRKLAAVLSFFLVGLIGFLLVSKTLSLEKILYYYPCDRSITFHVGTIDPRFNLSKTEAETFISEAAKLWNEKHQTPLFSFDQNSILSIDFVYDQRQALSQSLDTLDTKIGSDKQKLDLRIAQFKTKLAAYEGRLDALNLEISSWDQKGGAPREIYNQLVSRQSDLKKEAGTLTTEANILNSQTNSFNFSVRQYNQTVQNLNDVLKEKPEEGLFDGKNQKIFIYFVNSRDELVHTLAHEFGHALGIGHTMGPESIMYPYTSKSLVLTAEDTRGLTQTCQKISNFILLREYISRKIGAAVN